MLWCQKSDRSLGNGGGRYHNLKISITEGVREVEVMLSRWQSITLIIQFVLQLTVQLHHYLVTQTPLIHISWSYLDRCYSLLIHHSLHGIHECKPIKATFHQYYLQLWSTACVLASYTELSVFKDKNYLHFNSGYAIMTHIDLHHTL